MTQNMRFRISTIDNARAKTEIYNISLSAAYKLKDAEPDNLDNYKRWTENDNKLFKDAVRQTTTDINAQLDKMLATPSLKKEAPE